MDFQVFLEAVAGPAGAVVMLSVIFYAVWGFFTGKVWPVAVQWISAQNQHMEDLLKSHEEDRKSHNEDRQLFKEAMLRSNARHASFDNHLAGIRSDMNTLKEVVQIKSVYEARENAEAS